MEALRRLIVGTLVAMWLFAVRMSMMAIAYALQRVLGGAPKHGGDSHLAQA